MNPVKRWSSYLMTSSDHLQLVKGNGIASKKERTARIRKTKTKEKEWSSKIPCDIKESVKTGCLLLFVPRTHKKLTRRFRYSLIAKLARKNSRFRRERRCLDCTTLQVFHADNLTNRNRTSRLRKLLFIFILTIQQPIQLI